MLLHCRGCTCFDCKNGYTPVEQKTGELFRKYRKPTGKRKNRTKKINAVNEFKKAFTKKEREEYGEKMSFLNSI